MVSASEVIQTNIESLLVQVVQNVAGDRFDVNDSSYEFIMTVDLSPGNLDNTVLSSKLVVFFILFPSDNDFCIREMIGN